MIDTVLLASGGADAWLAAEAVLDLMVPRGAQVAVEVLHVNEVEYETKPEGSDSTDISPEPRRLVDDLVRHLCERGVAARGKVRAGLYDDVADDIVAEAQDMGAGLIVMGSRGRSDLSCLFGGSVSHAVIRRAACPVMVVREPGRRD
jgi:nucleotide-binding universal stress UspA family protein